MKDAQVEGRLRSLFLQRAPEADPSEDILSAVRRVEYDRVPADTPAPDPIVPPTTHGAGRHLLKVLIAASVLGEAAATAVLIIIVYRYSPPALRSSHFLYVSAMVAGIALVLLFAQWLLASRLVQAESLERKRARELTQAAALIREYQQDLEWTQQLAPRREVSWPE